MDVLLARRAPALSSNRDSGEIDNRVDSLEGGRIDLSGCWVPARILRTRRTLTQQPDDMISLCLEMLNEARTDESAGSCNGNTSFPHGASHFRMSIVDAAVVI